MANILANPLQVLAPALCQRIAPKGHIVLSGILARQADEVIATYAPWVKLTIWKELDGWVCLAGQLTEKKTPKFRYWAAAATLSALVLLQVTYLARTSLQHLLAKWPEPAPSILLGFQWVDRQICQQLPCRDEPVEDFSAFAIEYANLKIGAQKTTTLEMQVRNKFAVSVAWPSLELSITDAADEVIAQLNVTPNQWLPSYDFKKLAAGAPAFAEVAVNLNLELPPEAAGYRLRLTYPH